MQEPDGLNTTQRELELALRSVAPTAVRVDPVSAAFAAGKASGRRQVWFWRTASVLILAGGIGVRLIPGRDVVPSDRSGPIVVVQRGAPEAPAFGDQSVMMLQRAMDRHGADGLPAAQLCPVQTLHAGDVL
jgi:hypothetical protein